MSSARLDIKSEPNRTRFALRMGPNAAEWAGDWQPQALATVNAGLKRLGQSLWGSPWQLPHDARDAFAQVSQALGSALPVPFVQQLQRLNKVPVAIATDDSNLPWEWAQVGPHFLWQVAPLAQRGLPPNPARPGKVLLAVDPESLQFGTLERVSKLHQLLQPTIGADLLVGESFTAQAFLSALNSGRYTWVHVACLVNEAGLHLADGILSPDQLRQACRGPWPMGFFLQLFDGYSRPQSRPFDPWFGLFQSLGAQALVGTLWEVPPSLAAQAAEEFYRRLSSGFAAGTSLCAARELLLAADDPYLSAHSFQLLGNPSWQVPVARAQSAPMRSGLAC